MKLFYVTSSILAAISILPAHAGQWNLRRQLSESYGAIVSDDYSGYLDDPDAPKSACIDVKNNDAKDDQKLILGTCQSEWRFDSDGLVHTSLDDSFCMQAGRRGDVQDGEFVRLKKCDSNNRLQKFYWINGGGIRPQSDTSLCMVWRGVHSDVGTDPIIFKDCNVADDRNDYSGDFPREDYTGPL